MDEWMAKHGRITAIVGKNQAPTVAELAEWDFQRELAASGSAVNQCRHCGSYRIDSLPPALHTDDCPNSTVMIAPRLHPRGAG